MTNLQIAKLYVAVTGKAPTATDLTTYTTTESVLALKDFSGADNTATLNAVYQAAFGRDADAEGLAFWGAALTAGTYTGATIMDAILAGASAYPTDGALATTAASDVALADNKATVAVSIAEKALTTTQAATVLATVTADAASVTTASTSIDTYKAANDAAAQADEDAITEVGSTIALTSNIDAKTGTSGNDIFIGDNSGTNTVSTADQIAGGAGTDTFKFYESGTTLVLPELNSIENLYVNGVTGAINAASKSSIVAVEIDNATVTADSAYTLNNGTTVTLDSLLISANQGDIDFTAATGQTITSQTIILDGVSTAATTLELNFDAMPLLDTLNLQGANNKSFIEIGDNDDKLATVNISGDQSITIDLLDASVKTLDASASTGATSATLQSTSATTVNGGSGNDTITAAQTVNLTASLNAGDDYLNVGATMNALDSVDGGAGTDSIGMTTLAFAGLDDGTAEDTAVLAKISNFEAVRTTTTFANDTSDDFDISKLGFNTLEIGAANTNTAIVTGFTSGATISSLVAASNTGAITVTMTGATNAGTPDDILNVNFNANIADTANWSTTLDIAGINIVNVSALDSDNSDLATSSNDGYTLALTSDNSLSTVNVTGTQKVTYNTTANSLGLQTIDASASTGDFTSSAALSVNNTQGIKILGSAGTNTITGTSKSDIIVGGAKADTIVGGAGDDVLTGAAGADIFSYTADDQTTVSGAAVEKITDFELGTDILDFDTSSNDATSSDAQVVTTAGAFSNGVLTDATVKAAVAADTTLAAAIAEVLAATNVIDNDVLAFEYSGNTYIIHADAADAAGNVVELTGVTGVSSVTEIATGTDSFLVS